MVAIGAKSAVVATIATPLMDGPVNIDNDSVFVFLKAEVEKKEENLDIVCAITD